MGKTPAPGPGTADEMRDLRRQLHEAIKEARQERELLRIERRAVEDYWEKIGKDVADGVEKLCDAKVNAGLEEFREEFEDQLAKSRQFVSDMFEAMVKKCLGKDPTTIAHDLPQLSTLIDLVNLYQAYGTGIVPERITYTLGSRSDLPPNIREALDDIVKNSREITEHAKKKPGVHRSRPRKS